MIDYIKFSEDAHSKKSPKSNRTLFDWDIYLDERNMIMSVMVSNGLIETGFIQEVTTTYTEPPHDLLLTLEKFIPKKDRMRIALVNDYKPNFRVSNAMRRLVHKDIYGDYIAIINGEKFKFIIESISLFDLAISLSK